MAFKLKHSNVSATGQKLSPFKVDLVQGAKDAASKFSNVGGAFERGRTPSIEPETESTTEEAEVVSKEKRAERSKMLHILSDKKWRFFHEQFRNQRRLVLFENMRNGKLMGHTDNYIQVQIDGEPEMINTIHPVKLTMNHGAVVDGEMIED